MPTSSRIKSDMKMKDDKKNGVSGGWWNGDEGEVVNIVDDDDNEWPMKEEMRNIELEKELQKRIKRREGYSDRDFKHKDKVYMYSEKDSKHKGETDEGNRDYKHNEARYWADVEQDHRHKTGWARDDTDRKRRSTDYSCEVESMNLKDGSHRRTNSRGGSLTYDDRVARYKDNKDVRSDDSKNKDESSDYRSRRINDQRSKRSRSDYPSSDHHRVSKQEESKYRDTVHEERTRRNINSNRDLSAEKCLKSDSQLSPSSTNKPSSHLPPQHPFKVGSDSLLAFGSSEDSRSKINNPNWKPFDPNLGITQSSWINFPNWPYIPFHHIPPPMFNPFMYQPVPPTLRGPPMNMNHVTMPYQFTGNRFGNWDHGRTEVIAQSLESNMVSVDLQSAVQKHQDLVHEHMDEASYGKTGQHIENEEKNVDINTLEVMQVTKSFPVSMVEKDDDTLISRVYLSKIDVSKDLTRPELYDQCKSMLLDSDQASSVSDEYDCKILFLKEDVDNISNGPSLFAAVDDSVFKKAMSLYTKQKVCITATDYQSFENQEAENIDVDHPVENQETESCAPSVGDCEVKVNYDGSKEVDNPIDGGSLLVSTSDLIEFGSVNLSRIHSPE